MSKPPQFISDSELLRSAFELAEYAHHGPAREGDTEIGHPLQVAELLHEAGFEEDVVAAGLLHDVVEDTSLELDAIESRFGPEVARLVAEMTEDQRIEPYEARKAEHRARVSRDRSAAAIYAADKLATAKRLHEPGDVPPQKLQHYLQTLRTMCEAHPDLPFLAALRAELAELVPPG